MANNKTNVAMKRNAHEECIREHSVHCTVHTFAICMCLLHSSPLSSPLFAPGSIRSHTADGMAGARRCFSWPVPYVQLQRQRQKHAPISSILTVRMFRVVVAVVHHTLLNIIWSNHYCNSISFLAHSTAEHTAHDSYYFIIINSDVRFSCSFFANETVRHRQTSSRQRGTNAHRAFNMRCNKKDNIVRQVGKQPMSDSIRRSTSLP